MSNPPVSPFDWREELARRERCEHDHHPEAHPAKITRQNGDVALGIWCPGCGRVLALREAGYDLNGHWLARDYAEAELGWNLDDLPVVGTRRMHLCRKCREWTACEFHHIAPQAVFGELADLFPVVPLCRECHVFVERVFRQYIERWGRAA